jgi:hypothetical protein
MSKLVSPRPAHCESTTRPQRPRGVDALRGAVTLLAAVFVSWPFGHARAQVPPDGSESVTQFCGTIYETNLGWYQHGVELGQPYLGWIELIQELPEDPSSATTQWDCESNSYGCGTFHLVIPGFVPPQAEGLPPHEEVDITGPVESIHQSVVTYRLVANVDDFVVDSGPAYFGAIGVTTMTLLCSDCPGQNDRQSIEPNFRDFTGEIYGDLSLSVQVPGIGGSLAPPSSSSGETNAFVSRLGGACNNVLPATTSTGLVGLVALLVATTVFFARTRG